MYCWVLDRRCLVLFFVLVQMNCQAALTDLQSKSARDIMRLSKTYEMRNYMQTSTNPCENFYTYSCGGWIKLNPPRRDVRSGIFNSLTKSYNRRVQNYLQEPHVTTETDTDRKVKYFYESCVNRDERHKEKVLSILNEFGGMPILRGDQWKEERFDWLQMVALILREYGIQTIIGVNIAPDLSNNEVTRLYLGQLDNIVPAKAGEYYTNQKLGHVKQLQKVLGVTLESATKTAGEMVDFEERLARGVVDPQDGLGLEDLTRLRMLDEMSEAYSPNLNLTRFVNLWLGHKYQLPVYEYVESYLKNANKVIEETPKSTVANYILWSLLRNLYMVVDDTEENQAAACVEKTKEHFVRYLDNVVYRQLLKYKPSVFDEVEEMWLELKAAFEETLRGTDSSWMSEPTRAKALLKLSEMNLTVSSYVEEDFAKDYNDLVIHTHKFFENTINIFNRKALAFRQKLQKSPKLDDDETLHSSPVYAPEFNKVFIPVYFLQPHYLWDDAYPITLRYATLGFVMAHEMVHGFDDDLRKYDEKGNLNNWWDRSSTEEFLRRKDCFRQHYGSFKYNGKQLAKVKNQGENIADSVGIRIAYHAFQKWFEKLESANSTELEHEVLPKMQYKPRQLFFIAAAQLWCTDVNRKWRNLITATDVHAPEEIRVQGMLSNFDAFAVEFECPLGSKMNPSRKCTLY